jgi:hypothetical protein
MTDHDDLDQLGMVAIDARQGVGGAVLVEAGQPAQLVNDLIVHQPHGRPDGIRHADEPAAIETFRRPPKGRAGQERTDFVDTGHDHSAAKKNTAILQYHIFFPRKGR